MQSSSPSCVIAHAVAVPDEIESGARTDLDQRTAGFAASAAATRKPGCRSALAADLVGVGHARLDQRLNARRDASGQKSRNAGNGSPSVGTVRRPDRDRTRARDVPRRAAAENAPRRKACWRAAGRARACRQRPQLRIRRARLRQAANRACRSRAPRIGGEEVPIIKGFRSCAHARVFVNIYSLIAVLPIRSEILTAGCRIVHFHL